MKQKDLAEEYARKAFLKRNVSNPISIHDLCFNVADINYWMEIPELSTC